jgi:hypothetical protein
MASCAFLSRAAEIIFIALVTCRVVLTDAMRVRISFKPAMF